MKKLNAEQGIVCRMQEERFGYFGWPTVARLENGALVVASSGLRTEHVCPYGKTVLHTSQDEGRTWSSPRVIQDSLIDDRDAGVISLGDRKMLVSWFRSDTRIYSNSSWIPEAERKMWFETFDTWIDDAVKDLLGSWVMLSEDAGDTWSTPIHVPVSAPHGPILLKNGHLFYLGKRYKTWDDMAVSMITTARSSDGGLYLGGFWDGAGVPRYRAG